MHFLENYAEYFKKIAQRLEILLKMCYHIVELNGEFYMLLSLENIYKFFGGEPILENINLVINERDKIGLVGANGCGKTTLLSIITGLIDYDKAPDNLGSISYSGNCVIGYLEQGVGLSSECTVYEEMRKPFANLDAEFERMQALEKNFALLCGKELEEAENEYNALSLHYQNNDGYIIDIKIQTVLNGMGFTGLDLTRSVNSLSGGERTRLALARLLLESPSLLILDEPTNHLDLATMTWLESYLAEYKGAVLTVSHNRYFLDKICNKIFEIEARKLKQYSGNYTFFVNQKKVEKESQRKLYEAEQKKMEELRFFIDKNRASATSAKAAKSKQHMLDRIAENAVEKPIEYTKTAKIKLEYNLEPPKDVFEATDLEIAIGGKVLIPNLNLKIRRGEKIGIIGENGIGKSTILKTILKLNPHEKGKIFWANNVKIAYFDQKNEQLDNKKTVIEEVHSRYPLMSELQIRKILGSVMLTGENVFKPVGVISGGEKTKLAFALMMLQKANFLILDEPTNHLDILTKEVLEEALHEYEGTIVFVSHDRYLLNKIATQILEVTSQGIKLYKGNYDSYLLEKELELLDIVQAVAEEKAKEPKKQYRTKQDRAEDAKKKQRAKAIELEIEALEVEIAVLEEKISSGELASDYQALTNACADLERNKELVLALTDEWLELV